MDSALKFYIGVRARATIGSKWLEKKTSDPDEYGGDIYGPFITIQDAYRKYQEVLKFVDDDDYGIFACDDKDRWWKISRLYDGS